MTLQYLEGNSLSRVMVEALPPHTRVFAHAAYALSKNSDIVALGCTQVTHTSELGHQTRALPRVPLQGHRRHLCRTASRAFWPSVWLPSSQLAHSRPKKNSSWSSRSRPSPFPQASTSKPFRDLLRQAFGPASNPDVLRGDSRLTRTRPFPFPYFDSLRAARRVAPVACAVTPTCDGRAARPGERCAAMGHVMPLEHLPC